MASFSSNTKGFWEYFECGVHVSIGDTKEYLRDSDDEYERQRSNLFFGCLSAANGLRNAFVLVQISRFQQIIGVYTLQAPTEIAKVSKNMTSENLTDKEKRKG